MDSLPLCGNSIRARRFTTSTATAHFLLLMGLGPHSSDSCLYSVFLRCWGWVHFARLQTSLEPALRPLSGLQRKKKERSEYSAVLAVFLRFNLCAHFELGEGEVVCLSCLPGCCLQNVPSFFLPAFVPLPKAPAFFLPFTLT